MSIRQNIRPITYLKSRAAEVLDQINRTHKPLVITQNGEPRAVMQDPESYEKMRSALGIMKLLAQGERDVERGRMVEHEALFAKAQKRLGKRKHTNARRARA